MTWIENQIHPGQHWLLYIEYGRRSDLIATIHKNYPGDDEGTYRWRIEKRNQFQSGFNRKLEDAMRATEYALGAQEQARLIEAEKRERVRVEKHTEIQLDMWR